MRENVHGEPQPRERAERMWNGSERSEGAHGDGHLMNMVRSTGVAVRAWEADPEGQESEPKPAPMVQLSGPVMVVDDEPMVRKSLASAIERIGAEVVNAADGEGALRKLRDLNQPLIFTDVGMPKLDGLALL